MPVKEVFVLLNLLVSLKLRIVFSTHSKGRHWRVK